MKISVIVPAYNEEKLLGETLACIRSATEKLHEHEWELIVCDNNSTDATAAVAGAAGARVVFEPVNQISRARNAGAAHASGDWLVFVDADSRPSKELFTELSQQILQGRCVAGGSTVRLECNRAFVRFWIALWNATSRLTKWAAGSFIFCEAAAFRELGGFSQELYAGEEIDLFRRLKRLAHRKRRSILILHRYPMLTSGRKAELYTVREMLFFMLRIVTSGGRNLKERKDCYAWYDGRR